jgi:hypothetical protein
MRVAVARTAGPRAGNTNRPGPVQNDSEAGREPMANQPWGPRKPQGFLTICQRPNQEARREGRHAPTARPAQDGPGEPGRPRHPRRCAEGAQRRPTEREGGGRPPGVRPPNQTGAQGPAGSLFRDLRAPTVRDLGAVRETRGKALRPRRLRKASYARTAGGAAAPRGTPGKREPRRD